MIIAFSVGGGQAGYLLLLLLAVMLTAISLVLLAFRPGVASGRRTTQVQVGRLFRARLVDEAQQPPRQRKPKS